MARYLVIKKEDDITVVREEAGEIVPLSFGDFIEELASPHYERYGVSLLTTGTLMIRRAIISRVLNVFGTFMVTHLMIL